MKGYAREGTARRKGSKVEHGTLSEATNKAIRTRRAITEPGAKCEKVRIRLLERQQGKKGKLKAENGALFHCKRDMKHSTTGAIT